MIALCRFSWAFWRQMLGDYQNATGCYVFITPTTLCALSCVNILAWLIKERESTKSFPPLAVIDATAVRLDANSLQI